MLKILFFQIALNTCELWSNGIKIAIFSKNVQKIAQWLWALPPDPHYFRRLGALPPDPRLYTSPNLGINFVLFTFGLSPCPIAKSWLRVKHSPSRLLIFQSTISLSKKTFENFWWRHCMWFVVWSPPIKNPGHAYVSIVSDAIPVLTLSNVAVWLLHWVVSLRTNLFGFVGQTDPSW